MKLKVNLREKKYNIIISPESLTELVDEINYHKPSRCLLIIDKNVDILHKNFIRKVFANIDSPIYKYIINATEKNKSLAETVRIYNFLTQNNFDRNSVIIAVGGGIIGDIAGFAASTFMRGIKLYQVPTTLLSMVDSSVGGKTGVNFNYRKNLIGTFYQPEGVYIDRRFLTTLPKREIVSGAGEMFKYAFLSNEKNYEFLKNDIKSVFTSNDLPSDKSLKICLNIKADIVMQDEKEVTGLRKILNLGHTFAHSFEVESKYKLKHGEAVLAGVFCALFLSWKTGYLLKANLDCFIRDFSFITLNKSLHKIDKYKVYSSMFNDKKNLSGKLNLVLLEDIGKIIIDVPADKFQIIDSVERMLGLI